MEEIAETDRSFSCGECGHTTHVKTGERLLWRCGSCGHLVSSQGREAPEQPEAEAILLQCFNCGWEGATPEGDPGMCPACHRRFLRVRPRRR
jgi:DNA-directed RNA polymerase subunit RPC12/RpoP